MVIASIDIQNGKVVQLKQGQELVLQRDNPEELAVEFNRYGEVALIDLDAAMGKGSNFSLLVPLLRKAECRVGGGIRTVEQAKQLIKLGAKKIIIGSQAFRDPKQADQFKVNTELLEAFANAIGRERLIVAVDARDSEIVVDAWKTRTGLPLINSAKAVEPYAAELLFTCVEREGTMSGIDSGIVKRLRAELFSVITVAGGVSSLDEIESLTALGCDVQLGMALYTGKIALADAFVRSLNWRKGSGILPVIAQAPDGQVLMTGFVDREAVTETFKRGNLCLHSRTRNALWMKGEGSGNTLRLLRLRADCDRDALLAEVEPAGPVCHTGGWSCFSIDRQFTWQFLQSIIEDRFRNAQPDSYTATLDSGKVRKKLMEEAFEVCTASSHAEVVWEVADLVYFTTALMSREKVSVAEVLAELDRRHK
ncbi:MAG: phosphoribosyl-ATP diphosphatase [Treponema sp.]|jgi:phosphoribosyl-ATP pyrophosphohydrolase/phosphoribosyl-AMP cyclohydrolase|nr:phosphoribosyl-ATP diphosphatase [Treponema sp.]